MDERLSMAGWARRSPWQGVLDCSLQGSGLAITPLDHKPLIHVAINPGDRAAFAATIRDIFGMALPSRPRRIVSGELELSWAGVCQWNFSYEHHEEGQAVCGRLAEVATLTDLSASRARLQISGQPAPKLLAKGCPIDLHPSVFGPNDVAVTLIAHIGVHLSQLDDTPIYEIALFRSLAGSFFSWLSEAAQEFEIKGPSPKLEPQGAPKAGLPLGNPHAHG
ncbi:MAG: sarcosine oxidase subunit gamma family protein [Rhodomicrobium sp.]